jgi:hypothetical protein
MPELKLWQAWKTMKMDWHARKTTTMGMRMMANEICSYLKLGQARKRMTMNMSMMANKIYSYPYSYVRLGR